MELEKTLSSCYRIGERIQKMREKSKLTQKELAKKSNISFRTIQNYESNLVNPKIEVLNNIANCLDCDLEYFIFGKTANEIKDEQYLYFASMYKNLDDLIEVNNKITNINHQIDNIKNSNNRKQAIRSLYRALERVENNIEEIKKSKNKTKLEKTISKEDIEIMIDLEKQRIEILHVELSNAYAKLENFYREYDKYNINKEE